MDKVFKIPKRIPVFFLLLRFLNPNQIETIILQITFGVKAKEGFPARAVNPPAEGADRISQP